jgi:hypothetical protein
MNNVYIPLSTPIPDRYTQELEKRVFFVSEDITGFKLVKSNSTIQGIELTTANQIEQQKLSEKIHYLVTNDIINQKNIPSKILWRSDTDRPYFTSLFDDMLRDGGAFQAGEGQVGLGEQFIKVMNYFDTVLRGIAKNHLDAQEYMYPTLISKETLKRCGYFGLFPHMIMFVTRIHSDIDEYRAFVEEYNKKNDIDSSILSYCDNVDYCLPPTMCFHTYHQYMNKKLDVNDDIVITSKGKSFRFESKYYRTIERLWDFTIREIVFMGSREFVLDCRQKFMDYVLRFVQELGLTGYCEVANDPFFCNQDTAEKIWSQKVLELKYELRLHVAEDRTIAVGSFNFHEEFFGKNFNIRRRDDKWVRTACVGFGLERLVYAFLCQYGLNEQHWPQCVVEGVKSA